MFAVGCLPPSMRQHFELILVLVVFVPYHYVALRTVNGTHVSGSLDSGCYEPYEFLCTGTLTSTVTGTRASTSTRTMTAASSCTSARHAPHLDRLPT
eukprot:scaffold143545_cov16-Prasinocladus_malaysianus.AAC.1